MIGLNTESLAQVGDDWVLDVEVTTNRPDCLSHYGVARELATLYRQPLKKVEVSVKESGGPAQGVVSIEISDPDLCARYCGRVVQNVTGGTFAGLAGEALGSRWPAAHQQRCRRHELCADGVGAPSACFRFVALKAAEDYRAARQAAENRCELSTAWTAP